jgi:hypothetical protein
MALAQGGEQCGLRGRAWQTMSATSTSTLKPITVLNSMASCDLATIIASAWSRPYRVVQAWYSAAWSTATEDRE